MNNIQVNSIDEYSIDDRLRKDKSKEGKEVWNYVQALKRAYDRQKALTYTTISKIKRYAEKFGNIE